MCEQKIITYERCRHEISEKLHCKQALREIRRAEKRSTWCCIWISNRKSRVICDVRYLMYRNPNLCEECQAARRRERAWQVRRYREQAKQAKQRAEAEKAARRRQQQESSQLSRARDHTRPGAVRYPQEQVAQMYDEDPLYQDIYDLLSGRTKQEYVSPPPATQQKNSRGRESRGHRPYGGLAPAPVPAARASVGVPLNIAARSRYDHRSRRDSWNRAVHEAGYSLPLPEQKHEASDDRGEPLPGDDFLDMMERLV
jgi:hypothetical protein